MSPHAQIFANLGIFIEYSNHYQGNRINGTPLYMDIAPGNALLLL